MYKKERRCIMKKLTFVLVLILSMVSSSFAIAANLKTEEAKKEDVKGVFTLILYGGRDVNDIERLAILDLEGDKYTFEPYAPEFDYRIKKSLSEKEALEMAYKFVSSHNAFYRSQLSRIIDDKGNTIGYELRPLYMPFIYGVSDVLDVYYSLKGEKVRAYIRIIPSVERALPERTLVS
jgi:hypothetical protein